MTASDAFGVWWFAIGFVVGLVTRLIYEHRWRNVQFDHLRDRLRLWRRFGMRFAFTVYIHRDGIPWRNDVVVKDAEILRSLDETPRR